MTRKMDSNGDEALGADEVYIDLRDRNGEIDGFQFRKDEMLAIYNQKKEEREFRKLCRKLYKNNHKRKQMQADRERFRLASRKRWHSKPELYRSTQQARRKRNYEKNPVSNQCRQCGKTWTAPFEAKRKRKLCCSKKCSNAWFNARRKRGNGIVDTRIRQKVIAFLRVRPLSSISEMRDALKASRHFRKTIWNMVKSRQLLKSGRPRSARYEIHPDYD